MTPLQMVRQFHEAFGVPAYGTPIQCSEWCDELSMEELLQPLFSKEPMTSKPES